MFRKLVAAAIVGLIPVSASAATLTGFFNVDGGTLDTSASDFTGGDNLVNDVVFSDPAIAVDSVDTAGNLDEILSVGLTGTMSNIDFDTSGLIYTINLGGADTLTFTANVGSFNGIIGGPFTYAFNVSGVLSTTLAGYEDNNFALMSFSAQDPDGTGTGAVRVSFSAGTVAPIPVPAAGFLLLGGLGGLAALKRRKKA